MGVVTFGGGKSEYFKKSSAPPFDSLSGNVLHGPLPLEFANEEEPLVDRIASALSASGIKKVASGDPTSVRVLLSPLSALVLAVNETSSDVRRQVSVEKSIYEVRLPAGRSCSALIDRNSGNVVALTAGASFVRQK